MGGRFAIYKAEAFKKFEIPAVAFLLIVLIFSCNNGNKEADKQNTVSNDKTPVAENKSEISAFDRDSMMKELQGEWKEIQYPFRVAHFKDTTVKFIEEGVIAPPAFKEFKLSQHCPFEVNNLKNAKPSAIFLVMPEAKTCDIITVANDTLALSGFNVSSNENYRIVYTKVE